MSSSSRSSQPWHPLPLVPILLLLLALLDLRVEIRLIIDHFTLTALSAAIRSHLLAVSVILLQPSLWRRYRRLRGHSSFIPPVPSDPLHPSPTLPGQLPEARLLEVEPVVGPEDPARRPN